MTLNFVTPLKAYYSEKTVASVKVPGMEGEYGLTAGHTPIISQMKPGVLSIVHESGSEPEKFFVSGGFALTHSTSQTDISAMEAVKLDMIDADAVKETYAKAKSSFDSSEAGSTPKAAAQIQMETAKAMAAAIGSSV
eukprot:CAMPEP_0172584214 /NCGR_PEP_ID=MMETSP1068-20121228/3790_1 /TAXON_ID=35684 /ORGANISM="Pseudopedinella elastica, Strain CCMP716" /LENGTH=136 /DNA_ID=CAMNT_0013378309 /DNA_START=166 /DNA_END=576 /DNA_ORIENTATION=-